MKYTLKSANYNKVTGVSSVVISTELGNFYGYADLHPDDAERASSFFGCYLAEMRAVLSYLKALKNVLRAELKGLKDLQKTVEGMKKYNPKDITASKLRRFIIEKTAELRQVINSIYLIKERLLITDRERNEQLDRIYNKKGNK